MKVYTLTFVRSTKNKHVYSDGDILGAVYIPKDQLPADPPQTITVTFQWAGDQ